MDIGGQGGERGGIPPPTSISYLVTYEQILGLFTVVPPVETLQCGKAKRRIFS